MSPPTDRSFEPRYVSVRRALSVISEVTPSDPEGLAAGIAPRVREAKVRVAQAFLALRRGDDAVAEVLLRNVQLTLTAIELGLPADGR